LGKDTKPGVIGFSPTSKIGHHVEHAATPNDLVTDIVLSLHQLLTDAFSLHPLFPSGNNILSTRFSVGYIKVSGEVFTKSDIYFLK
jgi:hypothetical protein